MIIIKQYRNDKLHNIISDLFNIMDKIYKFYIRIKSGNFNVKKEIKVMNKKDNIKDLRK